MTLYAVGDVQGCLEPLRRILDVVEFDPAADRLWLVGDLVNRGPDSLGVLRLVKSLGAAAEMVLGNHDLHFLAVAFGYRAAKASDTLGGLLGAPDRDELVAWLRSQPFVRVERNLGYVLVHAGIHPLWSLDETEQRARELEQVLQGPSLHDYLGGLYGDEPAQFDESLTGSTRWRVLTNYFTRMRFSDASGRLDLVEKLGPEHAPPGMKPWFAHPHRVLGDWRVVFGHWAALRGRTEDANVCGIDSGCVWGNELTLIRMGDEARYTCDCR